MTCKKSSSSTLDVNTAIGSTVLDNIGMRYGESLRKELLELSVADEPLGFKAKGWFSGANFSAKRGTFLFFVNRSSILSQFCASILTTAQIASSTAVHSNEPSKHSTAPSSRRTVIPSPISRSKSIRQRSTSIFIRQSKKSILWMLMKSSRSFVRSYRSCSLRGVNREVTKFRSVLVLLCRVGSTDECCRPCYPERRRQSTLCPPSPRLRQHRELNRNRKSLQTSSYGRTQRQEHSIPCLDPTHQS